MKHTQESQDYADLVSLTYKKCPQEVVDHIQYCLFEIVFCPGYLYINRNPEIETCGWPKTSPGRPNLLSLSKGIQSKYEQRLLTDNTFILANAGDLFGRPDGTWEEIEKLHIAFTIRDLGTGWADSVPPPGTYHDYALRPASYINHSSRLSSLSQIARYGMAKYDGLGHTCDRASMPDAEDAGPCHECRNMELAKIWGKKNIFLAFVVLDLKQLTFDFTECYSSRGYWLGTFVAHDLCTSRRQIPEELEVLAPDPQKREELLALVCGPRKGS